MVGVKAEVEEEVGDDDLTGYSLAPFNQEYNDLVAVSVTSEVNVKDKIQDAVMQLWDVKDEVNVHVKEETHKHI